MNKAELESKHLSDLHALAAEAGVERFRMLSRAELIEKLSDGDGGPSKDGGEAGEQRRERPRPRPRRRRGTGDELGDEAFGGERPEREQAAEKEEKPARSEERARPERAERPEPAQSRPAPAPAAPPSEPAKPKRRRRRRRRFGRRGKEALTIQTLLLPPEPGRQAILYGESRESCTALLRGVAAELSDSKGPDPVALLIDPSPEELADWKREAPQAEIVSAGQPRHADDALAQAAARASGGEDVMLLIDSLTRLASATGDAEAAKDFFDAGRTQASSSGGTLTVVAALERPAG